MFLDRVVLTENMEASEVFKKVLSLPKTTRKENRHKFVYTKNKAIVIAKANVGNPRHREIGNPKTDEVAGYISFVFNEEEKVIHVYMNNQSTDFDYPKFEKLKEPQILITKLFGPISIDMEDIPKPITKVINLSTLITH